MYRKNDEDGKALYAFQYLNWKIHNGGILYEDQMNMLLPSIGFSECADSVIRKTLKFKIADGLQRSYALKRQGRE